ncbi:MAG: UDP-N-acetylmuramoyl-L-alanine--D-glutamate ligase [Spirochaetia bacterium]|nr:UDP-N-acetylmuramoyl-L-alanine--D-glutamate ligase [Spirochaetia bacterium]
MNKKIQDLKITVMGLGLNGGGFASAQFFASRGADVTVTDLRSREILKPTIDMLSGYKIRYVLEKHDEADFTGADIVIKNPAVPPDSGYLKKAKRIETDISIFLQLAANPVIAVTGSKGKSTTVSALYHVIKKIYPGSRLGGNITTSPLTFLEDLFADKSSPVVLELSSWQLADLAGKNVLKPAVSVITNILPDHLNRYRGMEDYVDDKKLIYHDQGKNDYTLCFYDDKWGREFAAETPAKALFFSASRLPDDMDGAWLEKNGEGFISVSGNKERIVSEKIVMSGWHNRLNLLAAGAAASLYGLESSVIEERLASFTGIPHRMEYISTKKGISFYNDTTATIPEAVIAAAESFTSPVRLISGGTDKKLDFTVLEKLAGKTVMIYLLEGSATDKMIPYLDKYNIPWCGPFNSLAEASEAAFSQGRKGDTVIMSPGCTSFGMFKNEFDRGDTFKKIVQSF